MRTRKKDILSSVALVQDDALSMLLEQSVGGMALPLTTRCLQIIKSMNDPVAVFRVQQILDFYADTLAVFSRQESLASQQDGDSLARSVRSLKETARGVFFRLVEKRASDLQSTARTRALPGADLSASMDVLELVRFAFFSCLGLPTWEQCLLTLNIFF